MQQQTCNKKYPIVTHRLTKEQINTLPLAKWLGPTHLIATTKQLERVLPLLEQDGLLGFDTETRPAFRKGQSFPPALLQLATAKEVILIQLSQMQLPAAIVQILEDSQILKTGVGLKDDLIGLQKTISFTPRGFVDLAPLSKQRGIQHFGLRGLAATTLGVRISKSQTVSNWAKKELTNSQMQYAATDAWISREIYLRLMR